MPSQHFSHTPAAWKPATGRIVSGLLGLLCSAPLLPAAAATFPPEQIEFFETKIRPVLVTQCYDCHSAQAKKLKADLRLDSLEGILKGGGSGPAMVVGDPAGSLLYQAMKYHDPDTAMPPRAKLDEGIIADFEQWVKMGAPWPAEETPGAMEEVTWNWDQLRQNHWAFQPMARPAPPSVRNTGWPRGPVDAFILAGLEAAGLSPAPEADRLALIRRASYDLTGLPPTMEENGGICVRPAA